MEQMKEQIREKDTQTIYECVVLIGGGHVDTDKRMVRAALIDVYQEREGEEAADTLMDFIGL
jgi:hypothetical protein